MPVQESVKSQVYTIEYHPLLVKTLSHLYYCCTTDLFPPDLCLNKCKKFSVHGTISSVVFQNIPVIITAVLETHFPPLTSACRKV